MFAETRLCIRHRLVAPRPHRVPEDERLPISQQVLLGRGGRGLILGVNAPSVVSPQLVAIWFINELSLIDSNYEVKYW